MIDSVHKCVEAIQEKLNEGGKLQVSHEAIFHGALTVLLINFVGTRSPAIRRMTPHIREAWSCKLFDEIQKVVSDAIVAAGGESLYGEVKPDGSVVMTDPYLRADGEESEDESA